MQDEQFITVTSKRKIRKRQSFIDRKSLFHERTLAPSVSVEEASRRLEAAKSDLQVSDYYSSVLVVLRQGLHLIDSETVSEILCYGLGQFSECMISRYQCALLLLLKDNFGAKILVHDPVFNVNECRILRNVGCEIIAENEEGCRKLNGQTTLVFLPHCPRQLTDNFLRTNWSPNLLSKCLLLSNSLTNLVESEISRGEISKDCPCSVALFPHSVELGLVNSFQYSDIFNDTALHVFPASKLAVSAQDLWDFRPPPGYAKEDIEFISKEEKPNLIVY